MPTTVKRALAAALAAALATGLLALPGVAAAQTSDMPASGLQVDPNASPLPAAPAQSFLVADLDTGEILAAISCGSVFMGANSYIGNAPNFMVKAIAEDRGIRMPSFFGYMAWSCAVLIPLFIAMTFIWFR